MPHFNAFSTKKKTRVRLEVRADRAFQALVTAFVSHASMAMGLEGRDAGHLKKASEKIFLLLCEFLPFSKRVRLNCIDGVYYVDQEVEFDLVDFEERMSGSPQHVPTEFLARTDDLDLDSDAQTVDTFKLVQRRTTLSCVLRKYKSYPVITESQSPPDRTVTGPLSVRAPDPHELGLFILHAYQSYPRLMLHSSFATPGKVVDMVASGDFFALVAVDSRGNIGGGVLGRWQGAGNRVVEFFGPYVFGSVERQETAQLLVDGLIESLARTNTLALATLMPTPDLPTDYFDSVGSLCLSSEDCGVSVFRTYFRHLGEDPGSVVRVHRLLVSFVDEVYRRLALPREIVVLEEYGESVPIRSIISIDYIRFLNRAILRPMWFGKDSLDNLRRHLDHVTSQDYRDILIEIDLGIPWHSFFVPTIFDCGFIPRSILPYAGTGDIVIFGESIGET